MIKEFNFDAATKTAIKGQADQGKLKLGSEAIINGYEEITTGSYTGMLTGKGRIREYAQDLNLPSIAQAEVEINLNGAKKMVFVKVTQNLLDQAQPGLRVRFAVIERVLPGNDQPTKWAQFEFGGTGQSQTPVEQPVQQPESSLFGG